MSIRAHFPSSQINASLSPYCVLNCFVLPTTKHCAALLSLLHFHAISISRFAVYVCGVSVIVVPLLVVCVVSRASWEADSSSSSSTYISLCAHNDQNERRFAQTNPHLVFQVRTLSSHNLPHCATGKHVVAEAQLKKPLSVVSLLLVLQTNGTVTELVNMYICVCLCVCVFVLGCSRGNSNAHLFVHIHI